MKCVKCGKEIPDGELFCVACSLNLPELSGQPEKPPMHHAPVGRMQTPRPMKKAPPPPPAPPVKKSREKKSGIGVKIALVIVSLLWIGTASFLVWQWNSLKVQKTRLMTREANMELQLREMEALEAQVAELETQLQVAKDHSAVLEEEIAALEKSLATSQSTTNQSQYDLTTKQTELDRLTEENRQLLALSNQLEEELKTASETLAQTKSALEDARQEAKTQKEKADFMDSYVVFVENNGTGYYHTYDCSDFSRSNFWAYSRKLAESNGYKPCPTCGGKP